MTKEAGKDPALGQHAEHSHAAPSATAALTATNAANRARLWKVILLTGGYMVVEIVGGMLTNSVALLSDAGHMLTDVASLALALLAAWFATREATPQKSFGYHRLEIIAALLNGLALLALSAWIIYEAIGRIQHPPTVQGMGMLIVAVGGLVVNIIGAAWLHQGHQHSLNIRAAFYHLLGDLLGSVAAVIAGVLILAAHWYLADPLLAIVIAALIIISAVGIVRDAVDVLLESTPVHIALDEVRAALAALPDVEGVHDLHVWTITSGMHSLSCHVVVTPEAFTVETLECIIALIAERFAITHQTIQLETSEVTLCESEHL
jgi:cobalt-zinc-cadmium efflux system protein